MSVVDEFIPCPTCLEENPAGYDICVACGNFIPADYRPWEESD